MTQVNSTRPQTNAPVTLGRRQGLAAALSFGASGLLRSPPALSQPAVPKMAPGTIDVHQHYFPPVFKGSTDDFLQGAFGDVPSGIKNWSPAASVEAMDRNGVAMTVVSTSSRPPQKGVTTALYRSQARQANEFAAKMVQDNPKRFAQFGFLPMPDVDGSLREIEYALDVLKAPGIGLMTSYGKLYQGNPAFDPVLQELDRRKAVVFCHPRPGVCCTAIMPKVAPKESLLVEFPYDTGRAVVGLLMSGSFAKYSNIRWIFCHCGDVVPVLSGRMSRVVGAMLADQRAKFAPKGLDYELQRQFYDTADAAYGPSMAALQSYVPQSQIMFGSDYPYVSIEDNSRAIYDRQLPNPEMQAIQRDNAAALMPQLVT